MSAPPNARAQASDFQIEETAVLQIQALLDEKASRTPAQVKISSNLLYAVKMNRGESIAPGIQRLQTPAEPDANGNVTVDISAEIDSALLSKLKTSGAEIISSFPEYNTLRAEIPLSQIERIAALQQVRFIMPKQECTADKAIPRQEGGSVKNPRYAVSPEFLERAARVRSSLSAALLTRGNERSAPIAVGSRASEGDAAHRAAEARAAFGVSGAGVKIGVLSDGVAHLANSQASGDLPNDVVVLPGQAGNNADEGTAMLEIVHDLAPDAQLFFATAFGGIAGFARNIRELRKAGCDIILDDTRYFVESPFQDGQSLGVISQFNSGLILQAVKEVTAAGALYFSSAGNDGNKDGNLSGAWEGDYVDGGTLSVLSGGRVHDFGGGAKFDRLSVKGQVISLFWSDPLGASANDYDLFVLDGSGSSVIGASTNVQAGTLDPVEQIDARNLSGNNNRIVIVKKGNAAARFLHLDTSGGVLSVGTEGVERGHSCAAGAFAVAATPAGFPFGVPPNPTGPFPNPFSSANGVELFSSDGPRRFFFNEDSSAITPGDFSSTGGILRQKPDITAADGVSVTGVGGFGSPFYGTSAAAPHAAAIAALIKSASPGLTAAQIRATLTGSAIDIGSPGVDRNSGAGIIMAFEALQFLGISGAANFRVGTITASEAAGNGNGFIEPGENAKLDVQLINSGIVTATSVGSTLEAVSPGVTVINASSAYPDIIAGGTAGNATPFSFSVSPSIACGQTLSFKLSVNFAGGSPRVLTVSLPSAHPGTPATFSYTGPVVPIPDFSPLGESIPLSVAGLNGVIGGIKFSFDGTSCTTTSGATTVGLDHTFVGDLIVSLTSPQGTTITLLGQPGGIDNAGNNLCQTVLDDSANSSILDIQPGGAPYSGTFRPADPLSTFNGQDPNGVWTLHVFDTGPQDTGNVRAFSLIITPLACAAFTGPNVQSFSPANGFPGDSVIISGANFTGATSVKFNGASAGFSVDSDSRMTATVPANATTGPISVSTPLGTGTSSSVFTIPARSVNVVASSGIQGATVTVPVQLVSLGNENSVGFSLNFDTSLLSNPVVAAGSGSSGAALNTDTTQSAQGRLGIALGLSPGQSFASGAREILKVTFVISSSTCFVEAAVTFGDQPQARRILSASGSDLTGPFNGGVVAITNPSPPVTLGPDSLAFGIQNVGTTSAAQTVTLTNTGTATLNISSIVATDEFIQTSACGSSIPPSGSCQISVAFSPKQPGARTGTLVITDDACGSPHLVSLSGNGAPVLALSSFSPPSGCGGQLVAITGTGFSGADGVKFNGTSATFTVNSDSMITASVPPGAASGPISITKGSLTAASSSSFIVASGPVITSISPSSGAVGKKIKIIGTGLAGASSVLFGGVPASILSNTATQIKVAVPSNALTGRITVTAGGCTAESPVDFVAPAFINSFDPITGPVGTAVTLRGINFTGASALLFKKTAAAFTVVNSTTITTVVPAGAKSGLLKLTTPAGTITSIFSFSVIP